VLTVAGRLGIQIKGGFQGTIDACVSEMRVPDAYVYCVADQRITDPRELQAFGGIRVAISDVDLFAHRIDRALRRHFGAPFLKRTGPVSYAGTSYQGADPDPGVSGFIKDPGFSEQHEFRLLWTGPNGFTFAPFLLHVPRIAELCILAR